MLRRVENAYITHKVGFFTKKGTYTLRLGARTAYTSTAKIHRDDYQHMLNDSINNPIRFIWTGERSYWLFQNRWYWDNDDLSADQIYALLVTKAQREQQRINRAQTMVAMQQQPQPTLRGAIPDDLKQYVWTRDGARCRRCGSNVELQFDHVIPVAFGGATSAENLQILCGPCNRSKGASVV
jgi:hypothetical protein